MQHDIEISSLILRCFGGEEAEEIDFVSAASYFCFDPIDKKIDKRSGHSTLCMRARKRADRIIERGKSSEIIAEDSYTYINEWGIG